MKFPLNIVTYDKMIGFDIAGVGNSLRSGTVVDAPGGVKVKYQSTYACKAIGIPEVLEFIVEASVVIDLSLFSTWLYGKVKDKPVEKIIIRRREITEISEENIRKIFEEEINIVKSK